MKGEVKFEILLFYKYTDIKDPDVLRLEQKRLCEDLSLKGRIIVAKEGINATLEGTKENVEKYLEVFLADPRFKDTHIKRSAGTGDAFPRLSIKVRKDLVSDSLKIDVNPNITTGKRLSPDQLHEWIISNKDIHIIDMRNDYEYKVGHFEGSVLPGMKNFRDLPQIIEKISHLKDKTVVPVCTGGVRCEKASGFLVKEGFKDVYQLDGGIVSYMEKYPGKAFKGSLYVFDKRKVMTFDSPDNHTVIGRCGICQKPSENYTNCTLDTCHEHFICCEDCKADQNGATFCSPECQKTHKISHIYTT
ncbi:MAG: rhodanese-related sulfurtransferase [Candidatus Paceibacterota bacterium]